MSINRKVVALTAALAALTIGGASHAQPAAHEVKATVDPGYWKFSVFLGPTDYRCVNQDDMAKFFDGPCKEKHTTCVYTGPGTVKQVGGGTAKYVGYWLDRHGKRTEVSAEGTYSARKFELLVHSSAIPVPDTITATWQSATCPPGAPH